MTKWLASVQSLAEAKELTPTLPDILDIKNPAQGALGALDVAQVAEISSYIAGRCQVSATIGDMPVDAAEIEAAMHGMAASGVDFIKIGLFPQNNLLQALQALTPIIKALPVPVIAVLFADKMPEQPILPNLSRWGFEGVMVDTAIKNGQSLLAHWSLAEAADFVEQARQQDLLCGLAGALRIQDIALLQSLEADYLGFRSALCEDQQRTAKISPSRVRDIQQQLQCDYALKKAI